MLTYDMNNRGNETLYTHIYRCIKSDIENGAIAADDKLPSKRSLAKHLGVGLITVENAYRQLATEGYIRAEERRGYFANDVYAQVTSKKNGRAKANKTASKNKVGKSKQQWKVDLTNGEMPASMFPLSSWSKCVRETLSLESDETLIGEVEGIGALALREEISNHLAKTRGLEASPENIVVGSGAQTLYNLLVQLLGRDRTVALEDPGYNRLTKIYEKNGLSVEYARMDEQGISIDDVRKSNASTLHIMPSHQFPTGIVTSISRRHELLSWATEEPDRWIIEDDYDCEFRLEGRPIPTLQGIDATGQVIYANTFTKSLGAAFRIAYLVLPNELAELWRQEMSFYSCTVPALDQLALARFMQKGEFDRHINRTKNRAQAIRDSLISALKEEMPANSFAIFGAEAGLHFILEFPAKEAVTLKKSFEKEGVNITPISRYSKNQASEKETRKHKPSGKTTTATARFVVQYLNLQEDEILKAAKLIASAYKKA
ncbi:MAG: PLP-dependent aminotransferase family protein [Phoenicibacter congonensis]|uniref:PLP-dependent aminotransferase family protein n=1 Tax=Phoenicibacter congonensis TaxID=1944646 RepID=A0AA43UB61_9ACTN|nr:PLP-dependent aminotransferase family protein [Phoenicibacter congonensis]